MPDLIVFNTSPLIALQRVACLDVIGRLQYDFVCPRGVRAELDDGAKQGYPDVAPPWLRVVDLRSPPPALVFAALDLGEATVIQLAIESSARWVAIDDWKGRRAALAAGLRVTGSLGLLGRAKQVGVIPAVRPLIEAAVAQGIRYHPDLVQKVLRALGELGP